MKSTLRHLLASIVLVCFFIKCGSQSKLEYQNTLAHYLANTEQEALGSSQNERIQKIALLDSFLEKCCSLLPEYEPRFTQEDVLKIFRKIDSTLYSFGFYTCYQTKKFSDAFTMIDFSKSDRDSQGCHFYEDTLEYRNHFISSLKYGYKIDCDLSSMVYYSIGEIMHYPIVLVEVPDHNFVRWLFQDKPPLNWDTNAAGSFNDECYRNGCSPTVKTGFNQKDEEMMGFLTNMNKPEILGYYMPFIGVKLKNKDKTDEAEKIYLESIKGKKANVTAMYYLAYMYVYFPKYAKKKYAKKALELSKESYKLITFAKLDSDIETEIIETYACACAATGDFKTAISLLEEGSNDQKLLAEIKEKKKCYEIYPNRKE